MNILGRFAFASLAAAVWAQTSIPVTGREVPELLPYENALKTIMQRWSIPGASLAITDNGRLVYARGLGMADREAGVQVQPASVFRLASISKTFTGMAILKLIEDGRFTLDSRFIDLIPNVTPPPGATPDARLRQVTVRQLLQHTGGWDRDIPVDHVLQFTLASRALSVPRNDLTPTDMVRYALGQPLDFAPGTRYSYSQTGYLILGRIIERVTGKKYEDAVRELILAPAGAPSPKIGRSLPSQREPDEVRYYDYPGAPLNPAPTVPGVTGPAPRPYANRWMEQNEAYGGWIGNAIDLMKYINALEGRRGRAILSPASLAAIVARPPAPVSPTGPFVGLTWRITPIAGGQHWWHSGGASGTRNLLARRQNNRDWVVLMNSQPENEDQIITDIFEAFATAETQVRTWPTHDLFPDFERPVLGTSAETLTFTHSVGSAPPPAQTLQLTAASALDVTIAQPTATWLKVDRLAARTPATLSISVEPAGLTPGEYAATLTVNAPNSSNSARTVRVILRVTPAPGFATIRNSASRAAVTAAAPDSRLTIERDAIAATADAAAALVVRVTDSAQTERVASVFRATSNSLDIAIPAETALGEATISVQTGAGLLIRDRVVVESVSPGLFSANGDGMGAAAARAVRTNEDGSTATEPAFKCSDEAGSCAVAPIDLGPEGTRVDLEIEATGVRRQTDLAAIAVRGGDEAAEVVSVTPGSAPGVDLITVRLPRSLAGRGEIDVVLQTSDKTSNAVKIAIQ